MNTVRTLTTPARDPVTHPVTHPLVRDRLTRSHPLRITAWQLTRLIGHVHAAATGADPVEAAAALYRQYPALQAMLAQGLAARPVATVQAVDRTLTDLVVEDADAPLDAWAGRLAGALVAA